MPPSSPLGYKAPVQFYYHWLNTNTTGRESYPISPDPIHKRVVALAPRLTSRHGAQFLKLAVSRFPFPIRAVQSDGGSEFLKEFRAAALHLQLSHYFNRPNYPQGNGRIERSFRTDEEELPADLGGLEQALLAWNRTYETVCPHQALGYKTPDQFYHHWLNTAATGKELLSDIS